MKKSCFLACLLLAGCASSSPTVSNEPEQLSTTFFAMDTYMTINLSTGNTSALKEIEAYVIALDDKWSNTKNDSEITKLNTKKSGRLSQDTLDLLTYAKDLSQKTNGDFDITVYPIVHEWGFTTSEYNVPSKNVLASLLQHVDYTNVHIDGDQVTLSGDTEITLGSLAKGYVADEIVAILESHDISTAIIDLGGNVHAHGPKADGTDWMIGIRDPIENEGLCAAVAVADKAVVTSGGYERFFQVDDQRYWHIINPHTGYPVNNGILSTTIIADDGMYADALSTALFAMGVDRAIAFYQEHKDFDFILITDSTMYITEGLNFSLQSAQRNVVIID